MAYVVDLESRSHLVEHVLPLRGKLKTGQLVELSLLKKPFDMGDFQALHEIFEEIIEEGVSYPQQGPVTAEAFRVYYTSHDVFVLREASSREILGAFYVKPNFPGRCSHICNHGFMVPSRFRNRGIGTVMARHSLFLSKLLGYKAVYYNLVFTDNKHAIHAYKKLGFQQTGFVPEAAKVTKDGKTHYQDAVQLYFDLDEVKSEEGQPQPQPSNLL